MHGYVLGQNAVLEDLQKLNWLLVTKRRVLVLLKISHGALCDDVWPDYLHLQFHTVGAYALRSLEAPKMAVPTESGTFQDSVASSFIINMLTLEFWPHPFKIHIWYSGPITLSNIGILALFL